MIPKLSRRAMLRRLGMGVAVLQLAACQPKIVEVEKIVKETVVVQEVVTVEPAKEAPKEAVRFRVSFWGGPDQEYGYRLLIKDYEEKNPHVSFEMMSWGGAGEYLTKILTMAGAGDAPEIVKTENNRVIGGRFGPFAAHGAILDLTDHADAYDITPEDFLPTAWETSSWEGRLYGIPDVMNSFCFIYNRDMFREAGLPTPQELLDKGEWTYENFIDVCLKLNKPDQNIYGHVPWQSNDESFVWMFGGRMLSEDGKTVMLDDEKTIEGHEAFYGDIVVKYKLGPSVKEQAALGGAGGLFKAQNAATFGTGPWSLLGLQQDCQFDWDICENPSGPDGRHAGMFSGQWAISSSTKQPQEAFDVINSFTDIDGLKIATIMKVGRTPSRPEVVDRYYYDTWEGLNVKAFVDAFDYGRTRLWEGPVDRIRTAELDLAMEGVKTVREALLTSQPQVQAEFDKGGFEIQYPLLKYGPGGK